MKTKFNQLFILLLFLLIAGSTSAQDVVKFSLLEAQEYALKNSYVIRNSDLDVTSARKKVWETIASGLPQVSGDASYTNNLNLPVSLIPAEMFGGEPGTYASIKFGQDFNSNFGLTVNQLIFDGSYIVGISSAQIYVQLSTQAKEKSEIEIKHAVAQAYYTTLVAEENLAVLKDNLLITQKLESDTKAMYENGFVEEMDIEQMLLNVQKSENEIIKAEREIQVARMVLKYAMGYDMDADIELSNKLDQFVAPLVEEKGVSFGFDYVTHIDYKLLDSQTQATEKLLLLEKSAYLPRVSGFYSWTKTAYGNEANLFSKSTPWYKSSMWGINVSVPIFSAGMKRSKVNQAKIDLEKAQNDQLQAIQLLQKDYLTAVANMESSVDQLKIDIDNKVLAKRIYDKTTIKYNSGIIGSTELSQTESQYIQTQGSWVASVMQLLNSKINLDKAIGE